MANPSQKIGCGASLLIGVGIIFLGTGLSGVGAFCIALGVIAGIVTIRQVVVEEQVEQARREEEERVQEERKQKALAADFGKWLGDVGIDLECGRCLGRSFFVVQLSAHGRSFQAQCAACNAKKWFKIQFGEGLNVADFEARGLHGEWYFEAPSLPAASTAQDLERSRRVSEKVKNEVWRRDKGRCTACGSNQLLEYDHIIPFSKGGSNTARNIQLLCEGCNRQKSAHI